MSDVLLHLSYWSIIQDSFNDILNPYQLNWFIVKFNLKRNIITDLCCFCRWKNTGSGRHACSPTTQSWRRRMLPCKSRSKKYLLNFNHKHSSINCMKICHFFILIIVIRFQACEARQWSLREPSTRSDICRRKLKFSTHRLASLWISSLGVLVFKF